MAIRKAKVTKRRATATAATSKAPANVQLIVNGQPAGTKAPGSLSISEVANELAKSHGIKSYSVLLDGGMRVGTEEAGQALAGHTSLEIFAKETRGNF